MLKIYSDFNERTVEGENLILYYRDKPLAEQIEALGLKKGDKVILYQDEDDFEVIATLDQSTLIPCWACGGSRFLTGRR